MAWLLTTILNWLGGGVLDRVLGHFERQAQSETERQRIASVRDQKAMEIQASVVKAGMGHKPFWIAWSIATIPLSFWFGWGMLDTTFPGYLPHTAIIPPGLLPWAQTAWNSLFYSGSAVAGASMFARAIASRR